MAPGEVAGWGKAGRVAMGFKSTKREVASALEEDTRQIRFAPLPFPYGVEGG